MKNNELCTHIRELMFFVLKQYNAIEDTHHIMEPTEPSSKTLKYLLDVKGMLQSYVDSISNLYIYISKELVNNKENEND